MSITFSSECPTSFEPEPETGEPRRRAKKRGRPKKGEEELKSSTRSKLDFEDFEDFEEEA